MNLLTIKEAAKILKVSEKTLRRWEAKNYITPIRTAGKHRRYSIDQLKAAKKNKNHQAVTTPQIDTELFRPIKIEEIVEVSEDIALLPKVHKKSYASFFAGYLGFALIATSGLTFLKYKAASVNNVDSSFIASSNNQSVLAATSFQNAEFAINIPTVLKSSLTLGTDTVTDLTGNGLSIVNGALTAETSPLGNSITSSEIVDGTISNADLLSSNTPSNSQYLTFNSTTGGFTWITPTTPTDEVGTNFFTDSGSTVYLTETGDDLVLGGTTAVAGAKLSVDGDSDQVQLAIQAASGQTSDIFVVEKSDGTDIFSIDNNSLATWTKSGSGQWISFDDGTDQWGLYNYAGSPEGNITANTGTLAMDTANGTLYVKTDDGDATNWLNLATGASSPWDQAGGLVTLGTTTNNVNVGGSTNLAKLSVDGDSDEVQFLVQGNGTQTSDLVVFETSTGLDLFKIANNGALTLGSTLTSFTNTIQQSASQTADITYTLPVDDGLGANYVLSTDGSGVLSWQSVSGIGGMASFILSGDSGSTQTISDSNTLLISGGVNGVDTVTSATDVITLNIDTTEIGENTFGNNTDTSIVWTFDQTGVTDPTLTFSDGLVAVGGDLAITGGNVTTSVTFDGTVTVTSTTTTNGTLTANGSVTLGDGGDTAVINSSDWDISAVGDMTGIGNITIDGRFDSAAHSNNTGLNLPTFAGAPTAVTGTAEGDIVYDTVGDALYIYDGGSFTAIGGGGYSGWTLAGDTGTPEAISSGNTGNILGGTNGIDTVVSATDTITLNFDATEVGTVTFGGGSAITWTFDASAGTDTTLSFGNDIVTATAATISLSGNVDISNGADITGSNLTVGGSNFSVNVGNGNITTVGTVSSNTNETINGIDISAGTVSDVDNLTINSGGDLTIGSIGLNDVGSSNITSGASLVGVYDEFTNSSSTTVQDVLDDLDAAIGAGATKFTQDTGFIYLTTTTDSVTIGGTTELGKLAVDGNADEIQLLVQGNGTQTANLVVFENSTGTDQLALTNTGDLTINGDLAITGGNITSSVTFDSAVNFTPSGTNDITFNVDTDSLLTLDSSVANGDNFVISPNNTGTGSSFTGTLTSNNLTADRTWTLQDNDGTLAFLTDIPTSDNYQSWTLAGDTGSSQTISSTNTGTIAGGTNGIDTVAGATDTLTINLDTTEIGTNTFGSGSGITWTFDASAGTDTTIAFGNNTQTFTTGTATFSGAVAVNGSSLTVGSNGTDGALTLFSEMGATDYSVVLQPSNSQTQNTTYTLPVAYAAASNYVLTSDTSGVMSWQEVTSVGGAGDITAVGDITSGAAFTATAGNDGNTLYFEGTSVDGNEIALTGADSGSDTIVTIPAIAGTLASLSGTQTFDGAKSFTDASGVTIGLDSATNTAGILKLISAGANDFSTIFQTGTQTQDITYTLPLNDGDSDYALTTDGAGVLTWKAIAGVGGVGDIAAVGNITSGDAFTSGTPGTSLYFANGGDLLDANGNEVLTLTTTASAVNELTLANAAANGNVTLSATGGDTDIDIQTILKGTGTSIFSSNTANTDRIAIKPQTGTASSTFTGTLTSLDLTGDRTYTLKDADGTIAFTSDIPVSDNYQSWTLAGDTGSSQTISSTNTGTIVGGTNGIDTVAGATDTLTINLDTTEIGTNTFGSGSGITWTFDASAGTDTTIAFGNDAITLTSASTTLSGDLAINGGNITTALTADSTVTVTGTLTANGVVALGDGGDTVAVNSSDWDISTTGDLTGIGAITSDGAISFTPSGTNDITFGVDTDTLLTLDSTVTNGDNFVISPNNTGTGTTFTGTLTSSNLTADRTWTIKDADGTIAFTSDIPTSDNFQYFTLDGDDADTEQIGSTQTLLVAGGTNGIDTDVSATDTITLNLDTTEINDTTFGNNSDASIVWTFDQSGVTDPTITFTSDTVSLSGDLAINGGNITTALTLDSTLTVTGTSTLNGLTTVNDDLTVALTGNENVEITDGATPTTDTLSLVANGATVTTGVNAAQIDFTTGDGTNATNSGLEINMASGGTASGDITNAINLTMDAADASTQKGLNFGDNNFDTDINATTDLTLGIGGANEVILSATSLSPSTSDGNALGTGSLMWSDLFLASGAVIDFNNGDVTVTHSTDTLSFAGGDYNFDVIDGKSANIDGDGSPTADVLVLGASDVAATDGVDALSISFAAADGANLTNSGLNISLTSNGTASGDLMRGIYIDLASVANAASTNRAIVIGNTTAWDTDIQLQNGETIDNVTDGTITLTAANTALSGDLAINGGNITTAFTADSTVTATGTLTANGAFAANGQSTFTPSSTNDITFNVDTDSLLTLDSSVANADNLVISPNNTGTGSTFTGTLTSANLTADRTWTIQDNDGTLAFLTDIPVSDNYQSWTLAGDTGSSQTISSTNTATIAGGTNGIDTVAGATDTLTINLDTTEVGTTTFGSGSGITWTFDGSSGTDTTLTFGDNVITAGQGFTITGTTTANGTVNLGDGGDVITISGSDTNIAVIDGSVINIDGDGSPTADLVKIGNGDTFTTNATNALSIDMTQGDDNAIDTNNGILLTLTPANDQDAGDIMYGMHIVPSGTFNSPSSEYYALSIDDITLTSADTAYALKIGSGWPTGISSASQIYVTTLDKSYSLSSASTSNTNSSGIIGGIYPVSNSIPSDVQNAIQGIIMNSATDTGDTVNGLWINSSVPQVISGSTVNLVELTPSSNNTNGTLNGINIGSLTPGAATEKAITIGTGWDSILDYNGTTVINGSGQVVTTQLSGTLFSNSSDSNGGTNTIIQGDTLTINGGTNGIDTSLSNDTYTINFDATEVGTVTFGSGSAFTWTFDASAGTDPTLTFGNGVITSDNSFTVTGTTTANGTLAANGIVTLGDGGDLITISGSDANIAIIDGSVINIDGDGSPTADLVQLGSGDTSATTGVDGLYINIAMSNASGDSIHITPSYAGGATDALTYNVFEVDAFSPTNASGTDTVNGIKFGNLTDPGATVTSSAINIGTGYDTDVNATTSLEFGIGGTNELTLTATDFSPSTSDGNALGTTSLMWSDLFLATGAVINYNNGDVTITHAADTLSFAGGDYNFDTIDTKTVNIDGDGSPTADVLNIGNGDTSATTGVDALLVNMAVSNASGDSIHITPSFASTTTGLTYNIIEADAYTASNSTGTDTVNGILLGNLTESGAGAITSTGFNIGTGYDTDINATTSLEIGISGTNELTLTSTALSPSTSDGNALGTTSLMWSDAFFATGAVVNFNNGDVTLTHATDLLTLSGGDFTIDLTANQNVEITDGATPTTDTLSIVANGATITTGVNAAQIDFTTGDGTNATNSGLEINMASGGTASGDITNAINLTMDAADASTQKGLNFGDNNFDTDINATTDLTFGIGGTNELILSATDFSPSTSDGNALGTSSLMWSDLFLASGAVVNFNNGDVTLTHAADLLTMAGGDLTVNFTTNQNLEITDGATPTTDTVSIISDGATVTTDANALEIDFTTGDGTNVTNSGLQIDMASGGTAAGDITNAINLTMDAADASTQKGLNFGNNNFDIDINAVTDLTLGIGDTSEVSLTATNFAPTTAEGNSLGSATNEWEELFVGDDAGVKFGLDQDWSMIFDQAGDNRLELTTAGTTGMLIQTANATGTSLNLTNGSLTTGTGLLIDNSANTLTTGTLLQTQSTATSLTTAADAFLGYFDWTPGSSTTASGDLFRINIGANGNVTNVFNVTDGGTSLFRVSESQIESAVPHLFSSAGDINMAYDLIFTNQTSSTIDSYGPLTVRSGESFESNNLTLTSYNSGNILLNTGATAGKVGVGAGITPLGLLTVDSTGTGTIGKAALTVIQDESQDIITASASATTRFTVNSAGNTFVTLRNTATSAVCHVTNGAGYDELTDCLTSVAADYAERYPVAQNISYGDVVMLGTNDVTTTDGKVIKQLVKSTSAYQNNVLGITSDNWGDFTSAGDNVLPEDNPMPVALSGRVPVKIASSSEPINSGDFITSSSEEGKAMKATTAGKVIATALESWAPNSGKETIMVFVNNFYYTPVPENSVTREEIEQLLQITEQNQLLLEQSQNWNTNTATTSGEFTDLITNNLFVTGIAAFDSLSASNTLTLNNNLVIGNGNIDSLTTPLNIQGSGAQALNFMAGKVTIDTNGNMVVQGDFKVLGTLDAAKVNVSNQIAGTATIVAGTNEVLLNNENIKAGGLIFVTPTSATKDAIYVKSQTEGQAVIGFETPLVPTTTDITFNWWIVGISN